MRAPVRSTALPTSTPAPARPDASALPRRVGVVGAGRLGRALAVALRAAGVAVVGPAGRRVTPAGCDAIVLCVPDREIERAAAAVAGAAPLVGHCSGMTPLSALDPVRRAGGEAFALHPLQSFAHGDAARAAERFAGCGCALAGSSPAALATARALAGALGMRAFEIADAQRPAYHAAASIASNFLVALEGAAERVAAGAGLAPGEARALLAPLVRSTVENRAALGPEDALTGPIARGDEATVVRQRAAAAATAPELVALSGGLAAATRALAPARGAAGEAAAPLAVEAAA
jgi:predicted short-subunit dehydrogenase-like oxidoreductase (DUF2520 family)